VNKEIFEMNKRLPLVLTLLALLALACNFGQSPAAPSDPGLLFQDDFSDPNSGWDRATSAADGLTDYENGYYRIYVTTPDMDLWANPGLNLADVRIEVDATKAGGSDDNDFAVLCRYESGQSFYFFMLSSDGYYGIGRMTGEGMQLIGGENLEYSDAIIQGNATNHVTAECNGSTLSLTVNGSSLRTVTDTNLTSGDVGLLAGTFSEVGTDIHFDNFIVRQP